MKRILFSLAALALCASQSHAGPVRCFLCRVAHHRPLFRPQESPAPFTPVQVPAPQQMPMFRPWGGESPSPFPAVRSLLLLPGSIGGGCGPNGCSK